MKLDYLVHLARIGEADIHPGRATASAAMLAALRPSPGERVLEIGCGIGTTLARVACRPGVITVGIDLLPEMLAQARRHFGNEDGDLRTVLVRGRAGNLPFRDAAFDAVYCESVLGFQSNTELRNALQEIFRVLQPGGRFIANEAIWKPDVDDTQASRLNRACERDFGLPQATEQAWDAAAWCRVLGAAGFRVHSYSRLDSLTKKPADMGDRERSRSRRERLRDRLRRAHTWLSPALLAKRIRYARLLRAYRPYSQLVEARLFVAYRP